MSTLDDFVARLRPILSAGGRFSKLEVEDCLAEMLLDLVASAPRIVLDDPTLDFLGRFGQRIRIPPNAGPRESFAFTRAYFQAHPVREDLKAIIDRLLREGMIANVSAERRPDRALAFLGGRRR